MMFNEIAESIITSCCKEFNITREELTGMRRLREFTVPRHLAIRLIYELTPFSLKSIATYFSKRDHTTIIHSLSKALDDIDTDRGISKVYNMIKNSIRVQYAI